MNKLFTVFIAALVLGISGCSSKADSAKAEPRVIVEPKGQEIPAYFYATHADTETTKEKLADAGFDVVGSFKVTKKADTIIVTTDDLKAAANKPNRGFGAVLRVLVDNENNRISAVNPVYFGKAFFQKDYNHALAVKLSDMLHEALGEMTPSMDKYEYDELEEYRFMFGMPYYEDMDELNEDDAETAELMAQLEGYKKGKSVLFKLSVAPGRTLYGMELSRRTSKFVKKIGSQNAQILPYTILIEDGKAKALAAKYYIAISYPLLSMGEFMTIATVPGAINKDLSKPFK